jgi:predicted nucleic acid-binding protein
MTDRWVVDASVVGKFYLRDESDADIARQLLLDFGNGFVELLAPRFLLYEISSAILRAARRRRLNRVAAEDALTEFFSLEIELIGTDATLGPMVQEAYDLAVRVGCSLYDAVYLAVASELGLSLITADARFYRGVSNRTDTVVWIGDYRSPS